MSTLSEDIGGVQSLTFNHGGILSTTDARVITVPFKDGTAFVNLEAQTRLPNDKLHSDDRFSAFVPSAAVARKLGEQFMRLSEQLGYAEDKADHIVADMPLELRSPDGFPYLVVDTQQREVVGGFRHRKAANAEARRRDGAE